MRLTALVLLALVVAGCAKAPDAVVPEPTPEPAHVQPLDFTATSCNGRADFIAVEPQWAQSQLPPGYAPASYFPVGGVFVLYTLRCDLFQGNLTWNGTDQMTLAGIGLEGTGPGTTSVYLLRAYHADGGTPWARALKDAGVEVTIAQTDFTDWAQAMTLTAPDEQVTVSPVGKYTNSRHGPEKENVHVYLGGNQTALAWHLALKDYTGTEPYLVRQASLDGDAFAGACPVTKAGGAPLPCDANTDDYRDFTLEALVD